MSMEDDTLLESERPPKVVFSEIGDRNEEKSSILRGGGRTVSGVRPYFGSCEREETLTNLVCLS